MQIKRICKIFKKKQKGLVKSVSEQEWMKIKKNIERKIKKIY